MQNKERFSRRSIQFTREIPTHPERNVSAREYLKLNIVIIPDKVIELFPHFL